MLVSWTIPSIYQYQKSLLCMYTRDRGSSSYVLSLIYTLLGATSKLNLNIAVLPGLRVFKLFGYFCFIHFLFTSTDIGFIFCTLILHIYIYIIIINPSSNEEGETRN